MHFLLSIIVIFLCSVSFNTNFGVTYEKLHNSLEFIPSTHELIKREELFSFNEEQIKTIEKSIITNPANELGKIFWTQRHLSKERKCFFKQMDSKDEAEILGYDWESIKRSEIDIVKGKEELIFKLAGVILVENVLISGNTHPLSFLWECMGDGFSEIPCSLCRFQHPQYRNFFEDILVKNLLEQHNFNDELNLLELGSGDLFQTLVILEKFLGQLAKSGAWTNKIDLHLIDPQYKFSMEKGQKTYEEIKQKYLKETINITCGNMGWLRFYQFINWFFYAHPDLNLHVFVYSSLDQYIDINQGKKLDAMWAVDLDLGYFGGIRTEGCATFVKAPYDDILSDRASAFTLMSNDQSIIQVLPKNEVEQTKNTLNLTLEEIAQIKFQNKECSEEFSSNRKCIRILPPKTLGQYLMSMFSNGMGLLKYFYE